VVEIALSFQNFLDDLASVIEKLQALMRWHDPTATALFLVVCGAIAALLLVLGMPLVFTLVGGGWLNAHGARS
jgi:hypothetical protein